MKKEVERLRAEVAALLQQAEQVDAEQDAMLGSRRGDELPAELKRRQERLQAIEAAMRRLDKRPKTRLKSSGVSVPRPKPNGKPPGRKPAAGHRKKSPTRPKSERNQLTDPEAKIMKVSNKGFDYCFNAQAMVDGAHQIIVAAETCDAANDKEQAVPMADATLANLEAAGIEWPQVSRPRTRNQPCPWPMPRGRAGERLGSSSLKTKANLRRPARPWRWPSGSP